MAKKSEIYRNTLLILICLRLLFLRVQFEDYVQSSDIAAMQSESLRPRSHFLQTDLGVKTRSRTLNARHLRLPDLVILMVMGYANCTSLPMRCIHDAMTCYATRPVRSYSPEGLQFECTRA